jgi:hypothetical protein
MPVSGAGEPEKINPTYIVLDKTRTGYLNNFINLQIDINLLDKFSINRHNLQTAGLPELIALGLYPDYDKTGYARSEINIEIIMRLILPFTFLIFSLVGIAVGWVCRSRYDSRIPFYSILFIPVFPFMVILFVRLYDVIMRTIFSFFALIFDFIPTLIICGVVQVVLMIIVLVFIAGKLTD